MNYDVSTPTQLRAVLRALRKSKGLTQEGAGRALGVNQRRIAAIEATPGVTNFDQICRLVGALGGRVVISVKDRNDASPEVAPASKPRGNPTTASATW